MRALVPIIDRQPPVPAIPPCDYDAAFARAVASPGPVPGFECGAATGASSRRFRRQRFAHLADFLNGRRYRLLDLLAFAWRLYVVLCVIAVTAILVICLGIVAKPMLSETPPPHVWPGRPAVHSASHAAHALTGSFKFQGSLRFFEPNDDRAGSKHPPRTAGYVGLSLSAACC